MIADPDQRILPRIPRISCPHRQGSVECQRVNGEDRSVPPRLLAQRIRWIPGRVPKMLGEDLEGGLRQVWRGGDLGQRREFHRVSVPQSPVSGSTELTGQRLPPRLVGTGEQQYPNRRGVLY